MRQSFPPSTRRSLWHAIPRADEGEIPTASPIANMPVLVDSSVPTDAIYFFSSNGIYRNGVLLSSSITPHMTSRLGLLWASLSPLEKSWIRWRSSFTSETSLKDSKPSPSGS